MRDKVAEVIEIVRPAIQADGGDINLLEVDEDDGRGDWSNSRGRA